MTLRSSSIALDARYPLLIERGIAQDIPFRLRDGSVVITPMSGAVALHRSLPDPTNPASTLYYSGAVTAGSTSLLALPAVATSEPLSTDWIALGAFIAGGLTYNFRQQVFLVGQLPYFRVSDEDIWGGDGVPELRLSQRRPQGQTDWSPQTEAARLEIMRAMTGHGSKPWETIDLSDLYEWHISLTVAKCCGSVPSDELGYFGRKAKEYMQRAQLAQANCKITYESTPSIRMPPRSSVIPCSPRGRPSR
jgi:hypothetical protein